MLSYGSLQDGDSRAKKGDLSTVIYIRQGHIYTRSSAVLKILGDLGGVWHLTRIGWIIPRPIRDFLYGLISRHRYRWFGKRTTCLLPEPFVQLDTQHQHDGEQK